MDFLINTSMQKSRKSRSERRCVEVFAIKCLYWFVLVIIGRVDGLRWINSVVLSISSQLIKCVTNEKTEHDERDSELKIFNYQRSGETP